MKIAVAEDNKLIGIAISKMLEFELGYEAVLLAGEIDTIAKRIKNDGIEVVLLDIDSIINNINLLQEIKSILPEIKIITLVQEEDIKEKCLNSVFVDEYCLKDIEAENLNKIIKKVFQNNLDFECEREEILKSKIENSDIFNVA